MYCTGFVPITRQPWLHSASRTKHNQTREGAKGIQDTEITNIFMTHGEVKLEYLVCRTQNQFLTYVEVGKNG
jgi:hypothetical protein